MLESFHNFLTDDWINVSGQSNLADRREGCSYGQSAVAEYENQTLEAFAAASCSYAKYDCPVACQNFSLLATAHDCKTGLFRQMVHILTGLISQ